MNIGSRISDLRKNKVLTQQELANRIFVTDKTISSWEANRTEPSLEILNQLSEILDCSVGYLVYGEVQRNDIETEIKIKLTEKDFNNLNLFMKDNAQFINESRQVDTYYQPINRKFIPKNFKNGEEVYEWLRIGKRGEKTILNYKYWYENKYCDEYEVEIDDAKNLDRIFTILGLEKLIIVDKTRKKYFYLDKYEVSLDFVKELGYFVEIEVKKYETSAIEEYNNLIKLAKDLNLNLENIDKRGYPYHLLMDKY